MKLEQYLATVELSQEVLEGLKNIQLVKKEIIENTPRATAPSVNQKFEQMIGRVEREEVLNYIIFLQEEGYSNSEILKMEEDFDYMSDDDIKDLVGFEFKERNFCFSVLGAKRANN
ncbi:hypothetical protein [Aquitalea pelogenes]|uniref:hypothetical protein n=1 Tax=Aquitalea pelogenes TaxID=1293573 RepID=UPI0035B4AECB